MWDVSSDRPPDPQKVTVCCPAPSKASPVLFFSLTNVPLVRRHARVLVLVRRAHKQRREHIFVFVRRRVLF